MIKMTDNEDHHLEKELKFLWNLVTRPIIKQENHIIEIKHPLYYYFDLVNFYCDLCKNFMKNEECINCIDFNNFSLEGKIKRIIINNKGILVKIFKGIERNLKELFNPFKFISKNSEIYFYWND